MLSITNRADVSGALNNFDLEPDLRALIGRRAWQLHVEDGQILGDRLQLIVVQGGDTPEVINDAVGFAITGEQAEAPSFETIVDHGFWFELAYVRQNDRRLFIFVENGPGTELGVHYMCLAHFWLEGEAGQ